MRRFTYRNSRDNRPSLRATSTIKRNEEMMSKQTTVEIENARQNLCVAPLSLAEWNGYVELTDECQFGMALFETKVDHVATSIVIPMKNALVGREVHISLMKDLHLTEVTLTRGGNYATVPLPYIEIFKEVGIQRYLHEYAMVGKLIHDIRLINSVKDRWLPSYVESLSELEVMLNDPLIFGVPNPSMMGETLFKCVPTTIGQYLLLAMCERLRKRIKHGMSLKVFIYALSILTKLSHGLGGARDLLNCALNNIVLWISQGTCDDCLIKHLRFFCGHTKPEYKFYMTDTFSKFIKVPEGITMDIIYKNCGEESGIVNLTTHMRRQALRTIGTHGFLMSPQASVRTSVTLCFGEHYPLVSISPTLRELVSLITILDLHSRVLLASDWMHERRAFNNWLNERRIDMSTPTNDLLDILITDLRSLCHVAPGMATAGAHLIPLLTRGELLCEMLQAYRYRPRGQRVHEFLMHFTFCRAATPQTMLYAKLFFFRFPNEGVEARRQELSFVVENQRHHYDVCPPDQTSAISEALGLAARDRQYLANTSGSSDEGNIDDGGKNSKGRNTVGADAGFVNTGGTEHPRRCNLYGHTQKKLCVNDTRLRIPPPAPVPLCLNTNDSMPGGSEEACAHPRVIISKLPDFIFEGDGSEEACPQPRVLISKLPDFIFEGDGSSGKGDASS